MNGEAEIRVMIGYSQSVQFIRKACPGKKGTYILNNIFANLKRLGILLMDPLNDSQQKPAI